MPIVEGFIRLYSHYPRYVVDRTNAGKWTSFDQTVFDFLYGGVPGMKQSLDTALDERRRQEYFNAHKMDYSDVHDPRNLPGAGNLGQLASWALNYTSHNLDRLYGDKRR